MWVNLESLPKLLHLPGSIPGNTHDHGQYHQNVQHLYQRTAVPPASGPSQASGTLHDPDFLKGHLQSGQKRLLCMFPESFLMSCDITKNIVEYLCNCYCFFLILSSERRCLRSNILETSQMAPSKPCILVLLIFSLFNSCFYFFPR